MPKRTRVVEKVARVDRELRVPQSYISAEEAEELLGVQAERIKELARAGKIPGARRELARWLIPADTSLPSRLTRGYEAGERVA